MVADRPSGCSRSVRALPPRASGGQFALDLRRQLAGGVQHLARCVRRGVGRIVDEQHDTQVRVLLQRGRQQRRADDPLVLLVGRNEHRDRRYRLREEVIDLGARRAVVGPAAIEEADAGDEVGHRRRGQRGDDDDVDDCLDHEASTRCVAFHELLHDREEHVGEPRGDRQHDRQSADHDPAIGDGRRHDGNRLIPVVAAPLPPGVAVMWRLPLDAHRSSCSAGQRLLLAATPHCWVHRHRNIGCSRCIREENFKNGSGFARDRPMTHTAAAISAAPSGKQDHRGFDTKHRRQ